MKDMNTYVELFIQELRDVRRKSENTVLCYARDLNQWLQYCATRSAEEPGQINQIHLNEFLMHEEKKGKKPASVARMAATLRGFFQYLMDLRIIDHNPTVGMIAPRIPRRLPQSLSEQDMEKFFAQMCGTSPKELRDRAMCSLMYETGIGVSELLRLELENLNLRFGAVISEKPGGMEKVYAIGKQSGAALRQYLEHGREYLAGDTGTNILFPSCSGKQMSRQGYWKMICYYSRKAGFKENMTAGKLKNAPQ